MEDLNDPECASLQLRESDEKPISIPPDQKMPTLSMKTGTANNLPKDHIDEVGSAYRIKDDIWKELSFAFWNSRSYDYVKKSFLGRELRTSL